LSQRTNAKGETLEEAKKINASLSALGNCINVSGTTHSVKPRQMMSPSSVSFFLLFLIFPCTCFLQALTDAKRSHIPFRDSTLTFLLKVREHTTWQRER
jgi:hypothetical protein